MSGKPQKQQQGGQQQQAKRKADAAPAEQGQAKKQNKNAAAPAAAAAAPAKAKASAQQAQQPKQSKKAAAAPEPEPESEEDDEEEQGAGGSGEPNPVLVAAADAVQEEMDSLTAQLEAQEEQTQREIFAAQKKGLLAKRPLMAKRDALLAKVPGLWKTLLTEHEVFIAQLDDVDREILDALTGVEITEAYTDPSAPKQQIVSVTITLTFSAGNAHVKAGKWKKTFTFDDEKEALQCTPAKELPFVKASFGDEHKDSFFLSWFVSEGEDEGVLAAQDALSSELYVDPLQLFRHVAEGGSLADLHDDGDDDEDGAQMMFEESDEEDDDDEAPQLAD